MRRFAGVLVAILWLAPAGLRLAVSDADAEALRCAIACGHAAKTETGAACCPMSRATRDLSFAACTGGDGMSVAPVAAQPAILAAKANLQAPHSGGRHTIVTFPNPSSPSVGPPDHIPLQLS